MTGCAFCGMKGFRVCDRCKAQGEAINADIKAGLAAWAGEGVPKSSLALGAPEIHGHIRCEPPRYEDVFKLGSEPEPVELTVDDVLGVLAKMERENTQARGCCPLSWRSDDDWRLSRLARWTLVRFEGRYRALGPRADDATEFGTLRDVLIEAKKRGLL